MSSAWKEPTHFVSIRAEVRVDEETGEKYFALSGDGWKDGEDTKDPSPSWAPGDLPVGAVITLEEPIADA
jgi:hypothetical protein